MPSRLFYRNKVTNIKNASNTSPITIPLCLYGISLSMVAISIIPTMIEATTRGMTTIPIPRPKADKIKAIAPKIPQAKLVPEFYLINGSPCIYKST